MGCGCGKAKMTNPVSAASRTVVTSSSPVPPQMQLATFSSRKAPSPVQDTRTQYGKPGTIIRRSV